MAAIRTAPEQRAWALVERWARAPIRKFVPGIRAGSHPSYEARVATHLALAILREASPPTAANTVAQILAAFLPRVFLRKGEPPTAQVRIACDVLEGTLIPAPPPPAPTAPPLECSEARAARRVATAAAANDAKGVRAALEAGALPPVPPAALAAARQTLYPPPSGQYDDEEDRWRTLRASVPRPDPVTGDEVRKWVYSHRGKSGDLLGWSPRLLADMNNIDREVADAFAALISYPISAYHTRVAAELWRTNAGTLLPQPEKPEPRPLSAPSIARRVLSATMARRARQAVARYCGDRGHVGMSHGGELAAYAMWPAVVSRAGGAVHIGDRSKSYQTFSRRALLDSTNSFVQAMKASDPSAVAAYIAMCDTCIFDSAGVPRTVTRFADGTQATSHALAQGCSSSPSVQSVCLAAVFPSPPPPDATADPAARRRAPVRRGAHDDLWITSLEPEPAAMALPVSQHIGGAYNPNKDRWVGARAEEAKAAGVTADNAQCAHATVFGAPCGDERAWAETQLMKRFRRILDGVRETARFDADAAVAAAHVLGGPGRFMAYQLSYLRPSEWVKSRCRYMDEQWAVLLVSLARARPEDLDPAYVFASHPTCLGHYSAAAAQPALYWENVRRAAPALLRLADAAGMSQAELCRQVGVDDSDDLVGSAATLAATLRTADRQAAAGAAPANTTATASWPGGQAHPNDPETRNVWIDALTPPPAELTTEQMAQPGARVFALARALAVPVWGALDIENPPQACPGCNAPRCADTGRTRPFVSGGPSSINTGILDDFGEHLLGCPRIGPTGCINQRHNTWAKHMATVSFACGRGGQRHDRPVFECADGRRPADFMEDTVPAAPAGNACDTTAGHRAVRRAEDRGKKKDELYAAPLAAHPMMTFCACAVDYSGDMCSSMDNLLRKWSTSLSARRLYSRAPRGAPLPEVRAAAALAFVAPMTSHVRRARARHLGIRRGG